MTWQSAIESFITAVLAGRRARIVVRCPIEIVVEVGGEPVKATATDDDNEGGSGA